MNYYYKLGDCIIDDSRKLLIIDREIRSTENDGRMSNRKWYKYQCLKCGNQNWIMEYNLKNNKRGCNACCASPQKVVKGINDIATTDKWMIPYFKNKKDIYLYNKSSSKKVDLICPYCGRVHNMAIQLLYKKKYIPCICSDGISFPNKFMYAMLSQLNIQFEIEKSFDWSNRKRYDNYIIYNGLKIITEQHGIQHYETPMFKTNNYFRTSEEERINDAYKRDLAIANGIDYYFEIDSRISTKDYMKDSIISSGLLEILNVKSYEIDWNYCFEFAVSSLVKTICEYKNNHIKEKVSSIAKKFKLDKSTIYNYFKIGNELGWLNYQLNADRRLPNRKNQKPIYCVTNDRYYDSCKLAANNLHLCAESIKTSARKNISYKGFIFKYISQQDFNEMKLKRPEKVMGEFFEINNRK